MSPNRSEPGDDNPVARPGAPTRIGRYELLERVGVGSLGALYRGRDSVLGREVAVKLMAPGLIGDAKARARFFEEAKAAARLQHANVVTIFEFGDHEQTPYIVMEFLRGASLADRMQKGPPLTLSQKLDVGIQVNAGLEAAHGQGVLHRDVKPRNIWITENGTVKLLDFGIATAASASGTYDVWGIPKYISPEQITGRPVDRRADIYSAGAVLYELFTGRRPFEADSPAAVLLKIVNETAPPIVSIDVPPPLAAAIGKAIAKSPDDRFQRAVDFGRELKTIKSELTHPSDAATVLIDRSKFRVPAPDATPPPVEPQPEPVQPAMPPPSAAPLPRADTRDAPQGVAVPLQAIVWVGGALLLIFTTLFVVWFVRRPEAPAAAAPPANPAAAAPATVSPAEPPVTPVPEPQPAPTAASMRFESQPPGARIVLNGQDTGLTTPAVMPVPLDQLPARVQFALPGFRSETATLTAEAAQAGVLSVSLSPRETLPKGRLVGRGDYAFELLDGSRVISAASQNHDIEVSGLRSLRLRADRYFLNQTVRVNLGAGGLVAVSAPPLGSISIAVAGPLAGCRALIDDRLVDGGALPVSNRSIASGVHRVRLTCDSGDTEAQSITILPQQHSVVRFGSDAAVAPR
jgi:serine/threonine-protein kinase